MTELDEGVKSRIEKEISSNEVVLFMKGTPVFPQCGFSSMVSQVLSHIGVEFKGVDVLAEPTLRDGIKSFFEGMGSLTALKDNFQVMCPTKKNKTYGIPKVNKSKDK